MAKRPVVRVLIENLYCRNNEYYSQNRQCEIMRMIEEKDKRQKYETDYIRYENKSRKTIEYFVRKITVENICAGVEKGTR